MTQAYPIHDVIRHRQNISQDVYLKFIKVFIDRRFEERFELMNPVFDLEFCLRGPTSFIIVIVIIVVFKFVGGGLFLFIAGSVWISGFAGVGMFA